MLTRELKFNGLGTGGPVATKGVGMGSLKRRKSVRFLGKPRVPLAESGWARRLGAAVVSLGLLHDVCGEDRRFSAPALFSVEGAIFAVLVWAIVWTTTGSPPGAPRIIGRGAEKSRALAAQSRPAGSG